MSREKMSIEKVSSERMNGENQNERGRRSRRSYFSDPTANMAIANVMREERKNQMEREMKRRNTLLNKVRSELTLAKKWNRELISIERLTQEDLELMVSALRAYRR